MKLFVSWSGEASGEAAALFKEWLPSVVQEAEVWVSSQDIGKGEKWSASLWESLSEIEFGVLMVTRENARAPWIMFEAGALSKTVKSRVIPILCDLDRLDVANTPLAQFQNAVISRDELWQVVVAVNSACERALDAARLRTTFDKWWPDFEEAFGKINFPEPPPKPEGAEAEAARLDKIEGALESIMASLHRMQADRATLRRTHEVNSPTSLELNAALESIARTRRNESGHWTASVSKVLQALKDANIQTGHNDSVSPDSSA